MVLIVWAAQTKDNAGAGKVDLAIAKIQDERLPRAVPLEGETDAFNIVNMNLFMDSGVVSVLGESMSLVEEAISLWSRPQLERQATKLVDWFTVLCSKAVLYDMLLSGWLAACLAGPLVDAGFLSGGEKEKGLEVQTVLEEISERVDAGPAPDEEAWRAFLASTATFVRRLPGDSLCKGSCVAAGKDLESRLLGNSRCRSQVREVLEFMCSLPEAPDSTAKIVDDWQAARVSEDEPGFLGFAVEFLHSIDGLGQCVLDPLAPDSSAVPRPDQKCQYTTDYGELSATAQDAAALPECLRDLDFVKVVASTVGSCLQEVVGKFEASCLLRAFRAAPPSVGAIETSSVAEELKPLFTRAGAAEAGQVAAQVFAPDLQRGWPCQKLATLFQGLVNVLPDSACKVRLGPFCEPADGKGEHPEVSDRCALRDLVSCYEGFSKFACATAFVWSFVCGAMSCVADHKLRADAEAALKFLCEGGAEVIEAATAKNLSAEAVANLDFLFSPQRVVEWVTIVQGALPAISRHILGALVMDIGQLSGEVTGATPRLEHVILPTTYHVSLAKKHVLGWPSRAKLSDLCIQLFRALSVAKKKQEAWSVTPTLQDDPTTKDVIVMAESVLESAKHAVLVIAALNVIHEMSGKLQLQKATELLQTRKAKLPKSLIAPLEKIAGASPPANDETGTALVAAQEDEA